MGAVQLAGGFFFFFFRFYSGMISLVDARVVITFCLFLFFFSPSLFSLQPCTVRRRQNLISRAGRAPEKQRYQKRKKAIDKKRTEREDLVIDLVDLEEE